MAENLQADRPRFLDTAKRLLALNTNTLPDDSAALSAIGLQKSVNQKNEIEQLKGLIADLRKVVQDIIDMCIKQKSTSVITCYFCGKRGHLQRNCPEKRRQFGANQEVDRNADRYNARNQPEKSFSRILVCIESMKTQQ